MRLDKRRRQMREYLKEWKEPEELARISIEVFRSDWKLIRTKPDKYAEEIEKSIQKAKLSGTRTKR